MGQPTVVDPDVVVNGMEPMLVRVMGEDVQLEVVPAEPGGHILVDPAELERAVLNLAINARDAMPKGGRFVIRTSVVGEPDSAQHIVALAAADTGMGMDAETAEHCFEPFYTTKGLAKGTGLGLAAVHAHGHPGRRRGECGHRAGPGDDDHDVVPRRYRRGGRRRRPRHRGRRRRR